MFRRIISVVIIPLCAAGLVSAAERAGAVDILAWTTYADPAEEYPNTIAAIQQYNPDIVVTEFTGNTAAELELALEGQDVFLVPEQELADSATLAGFGAAWGSTLESFATAGGSVVVCGEHDGCSGFLDAGGLLGYSFVSEYSSGTFIVLDSTHECLEGVEGHTLMAQDASRAYEVTLGDRLVVDGNGDALVACRHIGRGWAVLLGYDFTSYDDDAALIAGNAARGPYIHWTWQITAELAGAIKVYSICELDDGSLFAGTGPTGNVFRSDDGGASWINSGELPGAIHVWSLLPAGDGNVYAGTMRDDGRANQGRVFATSDGGQHWAMTSPLEGADAAFCLLETDGGTLLAGTSPGGDVFRTTSGGLVWTNSGELAGAEDVTALIEAADGSLYAGTGHSGGVYRSADGGDSWPETADLAGAEDVYALAEDIDGAIYAGTAPFGRVFRSEDQGAGWTLLASLAGADFVSDLAVHADGKLYATTGPDGAVFRSADRGVTWRRTSALLGASQTYCLFSSSDRNLYCGTGFGGDVFKSSGPATIFCDLSVLPASGTLPYDAIFLVDLINPSPFNRLITAAIDVTLAGGTGFSNWRAGSTILSPWEEYRTTWVQRFPALGSLVGENDFRMLVTDVTPPPYNAAPYPPSGDTDTENKIVLGLVP